MAFDIDSLISATDLNRNTGRFLDLAAAGARQIVLSQNRPIAAIVSIDDLRRLQQLDTGEAANPLLDDTVTATPGCTTIGRTLTGQPLMLQLACNTLVVGSAGSGKSVTLSAVLAHAVADDSAPVEIIIGEGYSEPPVIVHRQSAGPQPHRRPPIIEVTTGLRDDPQAATRFVKSVVQELDHRGALLAELGLTTIDEYNAKRLPDTCSMTHRVIVIEEAMSTRRTTVSDGAREWNECLESLLDVGPARGLHVWVFTQPGDWAVSAAARFPQLVVQRLNDPRDYRGLLGRDAASTALTGTGDALLKRGEGRPQLFTVTAPNALNDTWPVTSSKL